jgi:hypothetical protein
VASRTHHDGPAVDDAYARITNGPAVDDVTNDHATVIRYGSLAISYARNAWLSRFRSCHRQAYRQ